MPDGVVSKDIMSTTLEKYGGQLAANMPKRSPTLNYLTRKGHSTDDVFSGRVCRQPLEVNFNTNVQFYRGSEQFRVDKTNAFDYADFYLRQMVGTVIIEGVEEVMNAGKEAKINFVVAKISNLKRSLQMISAESVHFEGTEHAGKGFSGLPMFIPQNPAVGTVAGIPATIQDQRERYWWRSQVQTISALPAVHEAGLVVRPYTRGLNRLVISASDGADMPDMMIAGADHYTNFLEELQEKQLITDTKRGGAGFTNIVHMSVSNAPIVLDQLMEKNRTYMLNTDYLHQKKAKGRWMTRLPAARPVNQDISAKTIVAFGNLTISNRERQGVLLDS